MFCWLTEISNKGVDALTVTLGMVMEIHTLMKLFVFIKLLHHHLIVMIIFIFIFISTSNCESTEYRFCLFHHCNNHVFTCTSQSSWLSLVATQKQLKHYFTVKSNKSDVLNVAIITATTTALRHDRQLLLTPCTKCHKNFVEEQTSTLLLYSCHPHMFSYTPYLLSIKNWIISGIHARFGDFCEK